MCLCSPILRARICPYHATSTGCHFSLSDRGVKANATLGLDDTKYPGQAVGRTLPPSLVHVPFRRLGLALPTAPRLFGLAARGLSHGPSGLMSHRPLHNIACPLTQAGHLWQNHGVEFVRISGGTFAPHLARPSDCTTGKANRYKSTDQSGLTIARECDSVRRTKSCRARLTRI